MTAIQPIILAGGVGSRIWPLSRELFPKQLLNLSEEISLLQATVKRLQALPEILPPLIVVGEAHRFLTLNQLQELNPPEIPQLLLEPFGRNTAPAISAAVFYLRRQGLSEDTVLLVLPADHLIRNHQAFREAIQQAVSLALLGQIVTFGLPPKSAATGFGYIEKGEGAKALSFLEKPDKNTAEALLRAGRHLWNSGMFVFTSGIFLREMQATSPEILSSMSQAVASGISDGPFFHLDRESMASSPDISIDYALLEQSNCISVVETDLDWSDIGSWQTIWDISKKDENNNVVKGDVLLRDTVNSLVYSEYRLVTAIGLQDMVLIETADAILAAPLARSQEVKDIVARLKGEDRDESRLHRTVYRPWGSFTLLEEHPGFKIKRLSVTPGKKLSLQMHHHRSEHWVVVKGSARVTRGEETFLITANESTYIPCGEKHRLENPGITPLEIIEVQNGSYLGEDDIIRFEDDFDRMDSTD